MMRRLESVFWFIIEYGPTIFTISFAIYVIALAQTKTLPTDTILQWILAILGLLATSELIERLRKIRFIEENTTKTLEVVQKIVLGHSAEEFLRDRRAYKPLQETLAPARQIFFLGPSLVNIFSQWSGFLQHEKLNKHGAIIQALLLDANCAAVTSAAQYMGETVEAVRRDIEHTLSEIEIIVKSGIRAGSIEARTISFNTNFSMLILDPEESDGKVFVEFIGYNTRLYVRPHIELTRQRDGIWYDYFLHEYNKLWRDSQIKLTSKK